MLSGLRFSKPVKTGKVEAWPGSFSEDNDILRRGTTRNLMKFWNFGGGGGEGAVRVLLHNTAWPNTSYPAQPWPGLELGAVLLPQPSLCWGHGAHHHTHPSIEVSTHGLRLLSQNVAVRSPTFQTHPPEWESGCEPHGETKLLHN